MSPWQILFWIFIFCYDQFISTGLIRFQCGKSSLWSIILLNDFVSIKLLIEFIYSTDACIPHPIYLGKWMNWFMMNTYRCSLVVPNWPKCSMGNNVIFCLPFVNVHVDPNYVEILTTKMLSLDTSEMSLQITKNYKYNEYMLF